MKLFLFFQQQASISFLCRFSFDVNADMDVFPITMWLKDFLVKGVKVNRAAVTQFVCVTQKKLIIALLQS